MNKSSTNGKKKVYKIYNFPYVRTTQLIVIIGCATIFTILCLSRVKKQKDKNVLMNIVKMYKMEWNSLQVATIKYYVCTKCKVNSITMFRSDHQHVKASMAKLDCSVCTPSANIGHCATHVVLISDGKHSVCLYRVLCVLHICVLYVYYT